MGRVCMHGPRQNWALDWEYDHDRVINNDTSKVPGAYLLLSKFCAKRTFLFEDRSSLPGPSLKMAATPSPEVKAILKQTHDLTTALSNDSLGVAAERRADL